MERETVNEYVLSINLPMTMILIKSKWHWKGNLNKLDNDLMQNDAAFIFNDIFPGTKNEWTSYLVLETKV